LVWYRYSLHREKQRLRTLGDFSMSLRQTIVHTIQSSMRPVHLLPSTARRIIANNLHTTQTLYNIEIVFKSGNRSVISEVNILP
jgi:hypothetical protein